MIRNRLGGPLAWLIMAALTLVIGAVWWLSRRSDDTLRRDSARPSEMASMPGMDMSRMGSAGYVQFTPDQIRQFGITFDFAERRRLEDEVRVVAIVDIDETRQAAVTPRFAGYVERLLVDFTGQPVRRGQPMAEIYSPELIAAQEELLLAVRLDTGLALTNIRGTPAAASNLAGAGRERLRRWGVADAQIEEVLRTGKVRHDITVFAPISGVVINKNVVQGASVEAGQALYTIADLTVVWVEAELRETDAGLVRTGSSATIELDALPGRLLRGRVEFIYPIVGAEARTVKARIAVPNQAGRLKPGMFATVRITVPGRIALTIPLSALVQTGERKLVFVDYGNGRIMPQAVETGRVAGELVEVLVGIEPGQRVVTSAQFLLDSESNLAEVMRAMMSQMSTSGLRGERR